MATVANPLARAAIPASQQPRTFAQELWRRYRKNFSAMFGLFVLGFMVLAVIFGPMIYTVDPIKPNIPQSSQQPSAQHLLGTDDVGRDMLARILYGGRISLANGISAMMVALIVGTLVGAFSGFFGGKIDMILMRITEICLALPAVPVLMLIIYLFRDTLKAALGPNLGIFVLIVVVLGSLNWMTIARVVRSQFLQIKQREFVEACHALGATDWRIMFTHILPNCFGPLAVAATLAVGQAIITESVLSFLGVGFPSDTPTWGRMVADYKDWLGILNNAVLSPGV
ncbi:MAG TPA: ABC transporter permease, partial [Thermoflexales bacterium]|nr:ABC transporter permease [Thermoflexales bacterium]